MRILIIALVLISTIGCLGLAGIGGAGWYQAISLRQSLNQTNVDLAGLEQRAQTLEQDAIEAKALQAEAEQLAEQAERLLDCGIGQIDIDYSSNSAVSDSLHVFVLETYGQVEIADWEVFWIDSEDALHTVVDANDFSYDFFVYFDQPGTESMDGVFYLTWGCWLDLPSYPGD